MRGISTKSAKELNQILKFLPEEYLNKIPTEELEYINKIKDDGYDTNIKTIDDINSNNVSEETQRYLAYMFLKYLASEEEKKEYKVILIENEARYQAELQKKYNPDNLFKSNPTNKISENMELTVINHKENVFKRLINKIISFFNKNNAKKEGD